MSSRRFGLAAAAALLCVGLAAPSIRASVNPNAVAADPGPIPVGFAPSPSGAGYLVTWPDGSVQSHGDAVFQGSIDNVVLNQPIVDMAPTPSGNGYWLVAADGGIFTFGDANFHGSTGAMVLNQPIVDMAPTPSGNGYWLVAADGGIFTFGDANFHGSAGGSIAEQATVAVVADDSGSGYFLLGESGAVRYFGPEGPQGAPRMLGVATGPDGWWVVASDGAPATLEPREPEPDGDESKAPANSKPAPRDTAPDSSVPEDPDPGPDPDPDPGPDPHPAPEPDPYLPNPVVANTYRPPASIDATGAQDVTASLQAFLSSVPHHSAIVFPAGATYRIEGTLRLTKRNDLVIDGSGATFVATEPTTERTRSQWRLENLSNVVFENMRIQGANPVAGMADEAYVPSLEAQHGIEILGGDRIEVRSVFITDTYGDFIYVGGSAKPVDGTPTHVRIHDGIFTRNGRQGISVVDGFDVIIERNMIGNTRRATFDLEPPGTADRVREVRIRHNLVGPGRLMFVAGKGQGDASHLYVEDNTLVGRTLAIDLVAPDGTRRSNVVVARNTSDLSFGNSRKAMTRFVRYDHIDVRDNVAVAQPGREMRMVGSYDSCDITSVNNDLGPHGAGELIILSDNYDCSLVGPLVPAPWPSDEQGPLFIDGGRAGTARSGYIPCLDAANCSDLIARGSASPVLASSVTPSSFLDSYFRTMIEGDPEFEIPLSAGTYDVDLWFVEPTIDVPRARRFHLDAEDQRELLALDVFYETGALNTLLHKEFRTTVGDGALSLDFDWGTAGAIVSLIRIERV